MKPNDVVTWSTYPKIPKPAGRLWDASVDDGWQSAKAYCFGLYMRPDLISRVYFITPYSHWHVGAWHTAFMAVRAGRLEAVALELAA